MCVCVCIIRTRTCVQGGEEEDMRMDRAKVEVDAYLFVLVWVDTIVGGCWQEESARIKGTSIAAGCQF